MDIKKIVMKKAIEAKKAFRTLMNASMDIKNKALILMADSIEKNAPCILKANEKDMKKAIDAGLSKAFQDRLKLTPDRIKSMASGIREVAQIPDPVGEILKMWKRPNGLQIGKVRIPIGVIGVIYESRPNVTSDVVSLCIKSGNSIIMRGGSESLNSNLVISNILKKAAKEAGLPEGCIQFIDVTDREAIFELIKLDRYVDVIIPRGGEGLIRAITENSRVPVIKHDKGLCHTYVDSYADLDMAAEVAFNAKVQRPGVCNAMETLLVHKDIAEKFLSRFSPKLLKAHVEIRGCPVTQKILKGVKKATKEDWDTEYLDLILSIRVVKDIDEALEHIFIHGSGLAEAIITENYSNAMKFLKEVDASSVFVNTSTRFADGNQFGLGAEMGISTSKLHVRGPVGVEGLTTTKYIIFGEGQIRLK